MTDLNQIDAAIETMPKITEFDGRFASAVKLRDDVMFWYGENTDTILEALRVYKALLGEPSDGVVEKGQYTFFADYDFYCSGLSGIFKAMSAELIKQVKENRE